MQDLKTPAQRNQDHYWYERSVSEKWQRMGELSQMLRSFFRAACRLRNPGYTERQVHREVLLQFVGESVVNKMIDQGVKLYRHIPSVPEIDEDQIDEPFLITVSMESPEFGQVQSI